MQNLPKQLIFRIFSANDWNQPEQLSFVFSLGLSFHTLSSFFSNAENLRKIASSCTKNNFLELTRTNWNIGFNILFSLIPHFINVSI
jgi:hypothetical protein